jgi:hypothetical protein
MSLTRDQIRERLLAELPAEFDTNDELTGGVLEARTDRLEWIADRVDDQALLPIIGTSSGWYLSRIGEALGVPRRTGELDEWLRTRIRLAVFSDDQGTALGIRTAISELLVEEPEIIEWVRDTVFLGAGRSFLGGPHNWLRDPGADDGGAFLFLVRLKTAERQVKPYAVFLSAERFLGAEHYLFDAARATYSVPLWVIWWLIDRLRTAGTAFELEVV